MNSTANAEKLRIRVGKVKNSLNFSDTTLFGGKAILGSNIDNSSL